MSRGPRVLDGDVGAIVLVLTDYKHGLSRHELRDVLRVAHRKIGDSAMRVAIEECRLRGIPVVHDGERYRMAQDPGELETWIARELDPRLTTLAHQRAAMRARAEAEWSGQLRLVS